jgi:predicted amidohydrolase YtcJ
VHCRDRIDAMSDLVLREAEVDGALVDVRIEGSTVTAVEPHGKLHDADSKIECNGGALLPGLHDHHLHLLSMAAALDSVDVASELEQSIRSAHATSVPGKWIRAINYDDAKGELDRWKLDQWAPGRPVRVQHRSGALWVLSSAALREIGADTSADPGIERDGSKRPTGRLFRLDEWLQRRLPHDGARGLAAVGRRLASYGVTGMTDCTPTSSVDYFETVAAAIRSGELLQTIAVTGGPELSETLPPEPLLRGPVKIVLPDHELPDLADLTVWIRRAHGAGRPVAVHCVTRVALILALAAWQETGSWPGDRIEHGSVVPLEVVASLADFGVTVVTQPAFITARGNSYLREVETDDQADLYRCGSLMDGGVRVGGSTDAPYGPEDPWLAVRSAIERRAPNGEPVGVDVGLVPQSALNLFLAPLSQPGGRSRHIAPGKPADLCLLDVPLREALLDPSSHHVALTIAQGLRAFSS